MNIVHKKSKKPLFKKTILIFIHIENSDHAERLKWQNYSTPYLRVRQISLLPQNVRRCIQLFFKMLDCVLSLEAVTSVYSERHVSKQKPMWSVKDSTYFVFKNIPNKLLDFSLHSIKFVILWSNLINVVKKIYFYQEAEFFLFSVAWPFAIPAGKSLWGLATLISFR